MKMSILILIIYSLFVSYDCTLTTVSQSKFWLVQLYNALIYLSSVRGAGEGHICCVTIMIRICIHSTVINSQFKIYSSILRGFKSMLKSPKVELMPMRWLSRCASQMMISKLMIILLFKIIQMCMIFREFICYQLKSAFKIFFLGPKCHKFTNTWNIVYRSI